MNESEYENSLAEFVYENLNAPVPVSSFDQSELNYYARVFGIKEQGVKDLIGQLNKMARKNFSFARACSTIRKKLSAIKAVDIYADNER
ncbi:MAG: hypothetical protein FWC51_00655 [Proteobacteria bacterium]|nr:hypothetical protein [Pseudomonadota bacterium]